MKVLGLTRIWTTAYHPIANRIVERFHCHLKAAIKCQNHPEYWVNALPWILLGIHPVYTQRMLYCGAGLWHHTQATRRVHSSLPTRPHLWPSQFRDTPQRDNVSNPAHTSPKTIPATYVPTSTCTHVFVRRGAPLQPPYDVTLLCAGQTTQILCAGNERKERHSIGGQPTWNLSPNKKHKGNPFHLPGKFGSLTCYTASLEYSDKLKKLATNSKTRYKLRYGGPFVSNNNSF